MPSRDQSWSERMRDLIEQADRARSESERMRGDAERAMKDKFWPDRRREPRFPTSDESHGHHRKGT